MKGNIKKNWLSLLIPAYEYPEGILNILNSISSSNLNGVECIIRDDSITDAVDNVVKKHQLYIKGMVTYVRSNDRRGAVANWNSLLSIATGEYAIIMHHDERPLAENFLSLLVSELEKHQFPDLILMECLIQSNDGKQIRKHVPMWLKKSLLNIFGYQYLYRRNVVGSPSLLVVSRKIMTNFDERLRWLVDVEWMYMLLNKSNIKVCFSNKLMILSDPSGGVSITNSIRKELPMIMKKETEILKNKHGALLSLRIEYPSKIMERILRAMESVIWITVRFIIYTTETVSISKKRVR